ncbi:hypothetical protein GP662_27320 [Escherichia coli]|nr:hypothetical protein GP662_27320 [Escherichia coli]
MLLDKINLLDSVIMLRQRTHAATDKHIAFLQVRQEGRSINKVTDFGCLNDKVFTCVLAKQLPDELHRKE